MSSDVEMEVEMEVDGREDYERRERAECAFRAGLRARGHRCVVTLETFPSQTRWCGRAVCVNAPAKKRDV